MLEKTVFANDLEIKNIIQKVYGLRPENVERLNRGSANLYKIEYNSNYYILKEFQSKYTDIEVKKEINVINHLKRKKVKVPTYVKCLNGNDSFIYKEKTIIMQEFIDGYTMEPNNGDYSVMQFIYKDGKINAITDFVSACKMPIVWEIIRSYSYIDEKAKDGEFDINNLIDYVKEFCKYVSLNKCDIKYMPYVYMLQLLNSTYGYKQFLNDRNNKEMLDFGRLRTNICRYLYNNAELISKKLLENIEVH